jgi:hypothetical protein
MRRFSNGLAQSDLVRPEPASSGFVLFPLSLVSSSVKFSPLLLFVIPRFILLTMQDPFRYSAQSIPAFIWQLIWYNTLWSDWVTRVDSSDFDAIISKTLLVLEALAFGLIGIVPIHSRVLHGSAFTWLNASLDYVSREESLHPTHWWLIRYTISLYTLSFSFSGRNNEILFFFLQRNCWFNM